MYHLKQIYEEKIRLIQSLVRPRLPQQTTQLNISYFHFQVGGSNFETVKLREEIKNLYIDSDVALMTTKLLNQIALRNETTNNEPIDRYFAKVTNVLADECLVKKTSVQCQPKL